MTMQYIIDQREALREAHNSRFSIGDWEYRVRYDGGLAEAFSIYGRKGGGGFSYITGFSGFKCHSKEQVIALAKELVRKNSKS